MVVSRAGLAMGGRMSAEKVIKHVRLRDAKASVLNNAKTYTGTGGHWRVRADDPALIVLRFANLGLHLDDRCKSKFRAQYGREPTEDEVHTAVIDVMTEMENRLKNGDAVPFKFPETFKDGHKMAEHIDNVETEKYSGYLSMAWNSITDAQRQELIDRFNARVLKAINSGGGPLEARTKEVILQCVARLAQEEIDRRLEEIRAQVVKEVDRRWGEVVEQLVSRRLAEAVAKIKLEFSK